MNAQSETLIWEGRPSQVKNLPIYLLCLLFCWLIVPIFYALWKWIELRCFTYRITSERISIRQGVFNKRTDEWELYRVKDSTLVEPFWYRLFSLANIVINSSDRSMPTLLIEAVGNAQTIREQIRLNVERLREQKRVREFDSSP